MGLAYHRHVYPTPELNFPDTEPKQRPQPRNLDWRAIERMVTRIVRSYKFDRDHESIVLFAERLGGRLIMLRAGEEPQLREKSLVVYGAENFHILIEPDSTQPNDNFHVAHELGHYFLHAEDERTKRVMPLIAGRGGDSETEREANRFALALLMPVDEFRAVAKATKNNVNLLAIRFGVPRKVAEARLNQISSDATAPAPGSRSKH